MQQLLNTYVRRFQVNPPYVVSLPNPELSLIVVIPSFKEPDILSTLNSLAACHPPNGSVEIIVLINAPEDAGAEIIRLNQTTFDKMIDWKAKHQPHFMDVLILREENLPIKFAGAGWARKIGMDEALRRWALLDIDGPIVCLDADCTVSQNYLIAAERAFENQGLSLGHFEFCHLWQNEPNTVLRKGIIAYEIHLRCHILGLAIAGYPFAVHTVGSCMAVRASVYAKVGGMNRRKAGEDFYFMHKILPLGVFAYIPATVYPSCRVSDRVPFGTGRAQLEWLSGGSERTTYSNSIYVVLRDLFEEIETWFLMNIAWDKLHPQVAAFLRKHHLQEMVLQMKQQSTTQAAFRKRFWQWMDGFKLLKLVHYLRENGFSNEPLEDVAQELNQKTKDQKIEDLLIAWKLN